MLRRKFGPKREGVKREWRELHNEELNDLYSSPNIIRVIKTRRMVRAGHVTRVGGSGGTYRVLVRKPEGKKPFEDSGVDGRIILRWIFRKWVGGMEWIDLDQGRDR